MEPRKSLPGDPNADRRRRSIYSPPHENIQSSISDIPPTPPHPPSSGTLLSSISESSDSALKDIEPHNSRERKEKGDKGDGGKRDGHKGDGDKEDGREDQEVGTAVGATGLRDSSKRTADNAGLNKGSNGWHSSKEAEGIGQCAGLYRLGYVLLFQKTES